MFILLSLVTLVFGPFHLRGNNITHVENLRIVLILSLLFFIVWPTGRSFLEGCAIMLVAQISSLSHSSKDAWEPDRQRE